jgi:hypothetical protein
MERKIRTQHECESVRGTHFLESPDGKISQVMEKMRASEENSPPGEPDRETSQDAERM